MKTDEYLILLLAEECAEISEVCSRIAIRAFKALRFGISEVQPGQLQDNAQRLLAELVDIAGTIEYLVDSGFITRDDIKAKKCKIARFLDYSRQLGVIEREGQADPNSQGGNA